MSRGRRAVQPVALENPERDMVLEDRIADVDTSDPGYGSLRERIIAARHLGPRPEDGCRHCWTKGRDAALAILAGTVGDDLEQILELARVIEPAGSELHWRASWERGRDAALEVIEGE